MNELGLLLFASICIAGWSVLIESEKMINDQKKDKYDDK